MSASSNSASGLNPECPGLGVPRKPRLWLRWLRRASQVVFLGLFFFLLFQTEFRGSFSRGATEAIRLDYPVSIFLEMDPLVAFSTALATHAIYGKVIWALVIIAMSVFTSLQTGILDPIPFLVRSLSTSVLPALSYGMRGTFDFLYGTNIGAFQWVADAGYQVFGSNI